MAMDLSAIDAADQVVRECVGSHNLLNETGDGRRLRLFKLQRILNALSLEYEGITDRSFGPDDARDPEKKAARDAARDAREAVLQDATVEQNASADDADTSE